jgi:hypothetical protein
MVTAGFAWRLGILLSMALITGSEAGQFARPEDKQGARGITSRGGQFVLRIEQRSVEFDPCNREDLLRLEQAVRLELVKNVEHDLPDKIANEKRLHRGLREVRRLTEDLLSCEESREEPRLRTLLLETVMAVNNLRRSPMPEKVDFFQTPWFFLKRLPRPVGVGQTIATSLLAGDGGDLSLSDPEPSTFWRRPSSIACEDLYHGFGRTNLLLGSDPLCTYAAPKESFGRNPGFEVECDGTKMKLKFAEVSSEPFASRIFDALGYHADPTDYAPRVRVRYSRRMLQEFNSRKPLKTHFTFMGFVPLFTLELQKRYDPFEYFTRAVLIDGRTWSSSQLKRRLFLNPNRYHPEEDASNFRSEVESAIDYLETAAANVQLKTGKSIGPWDFGDLDHASRRELRGAGLLAGWLGWFDTRFDNTRLRIVQHKGRPDLEHYFSDLGGALGKTSGLLYSRGESPNAFPWTFTRPAPRQGRQGAAIPFRLHGYKPIARTPAFAEMTLDDARWMARLIGALSDKQITQALVASGFDSSQARLYLEKLVNRRDQMVLDLGLASEIPLCCESGKGRHFSYDPAVDGAIQVDVGAEIIQAPITGDIIVNGRLAKNRMKIIGKSPARAGVLRFRGSR